MIFERAPAGFLRRRSSTVPGRVRVGCSGWQYRHWRGNFYPPDVPQKRWLEYYASVFDTVEHLCGADWIWRSRWEGVSPMALPSPDSYDTLAKVRAAWEDEERRIRAIMNGLGPDGIARPILYIGWDGRPQAQPFWQMLQHLVNHGSYHRGQITTMLRQLNVPPAKSMDLIAFYRERANVTT